MKVADTLSHRSRGKYGYHREKQNPEIIWSLSLSLTLTHTHTHTHTWQTGFPIFLFVFRLLLDNIESGNQGIGCPCNLGMVEMLLYKCPEGVRPEPFHWTASSTVQTPLTQENFNLQAVNDDLTFFSCLSGEVNKCEWKRQIMFVMLK
jgi:hypothetical protein